MSNPSFDQAYQMLNLAREAGASLETLQALYMSGLLSDLLRVENPAVVDREKFRTLLGFDPLFSRVKLGGPETTDDIVRMLRKGGFLVNNPITQKNFPLAPHEAQDIEIKVVDPGCSFSEAEGLDLLKAAGLERPTYEHALRFAEQYGMMTSSTKKPFVVFLHEAWLDPGGDRHVLCLHRDSADRRLCLRCPGRRFDGDCGLAGVRPCKPKPSVV